MYTQHPHKVWTIEWVAREMEAPFPFPLEPQDFREVYTPTSQTPSFHPIPKVAPGPWSPSVLDKILHPLSPNEEGLCKSYVNRFLWPIPLTNSLGRFYIWKTDSFPQPFSGGPAEGLETSQRLTSASSAPPTSSLWAEGDSPLGFTPSSLPHPQSR